MPCSCGADAHRASHGLQNRPCPVEGCLFAACHDGQGGCFRSPGAAGNGCVEAINPRLGEPCRVVARLCRLDGAHVDENAAGRDGAGNPLTEQEIGDRGAVAYHDDDEVRCGNGFGRPGKELGTVFGERPGLFDGPVPGPDGISRPEQVSRHGRSHQPGSQYCDDGLAHGLSFLLDCVSQVIFWCSRIHP